MAEEKVINPANTGGTQEREPAVNGSAQTTTQSDGVKSEQQKPNTLQFTQDALNAMMAKEKTSGRRSVLKQFGISDEEDPTEKISKFNAYLESEKSKETDGDKLKNLSSDFDRLKNDHTAALAENTVLKQEKILHRHGVSDSDEKFEFLMYVIGKAVTDEKDFEQAAAEYFEKNPVDTKKPPFISASVGKDATKTTDSVLGAFRRGAGLKEKT